MLHWIASLHVLAKLHGHACRLLCFAKVQIRARLIVYSAEKHGLASMPSET